MKSVGESEVDSKGEGEEVGKNRLYVQLYFELTCLLITAPMEPPMYILKSNRKHGLLDSDENLSFVVGCWVILKVR